MLRDCCGQATIFRRGLPDSAFDVRSLIGFASHVELELSNGAFVRAAFNGNVLRLPCADFNGLCTMARFEALLHSTAVNETRWFKSA